MSDEAFDPYWQWLGIPPHDRPLNHYRLLGLPSFESDMTRIARAADERMMQVRSYQSGPRVAYSQKLLNELAAARVCLLDPNTKATYDAVLQATLAVQAGQVAVVRPPVPVPTSATPPSPPPIHPAAPSPPTVPPSPPPPPPHQPRRTSTPHAGAVAAAPAASAAPSVNAATSPANSANGGAVDADEDRVSMFAQPWFPVAAIGCIVLIAGVIWGANRLTRRTVDINQDADAKSADGSETKGGQDAAADDVMTKGGKASDGGATGGTSGDDEPVIISQESTGEVNFTPGTALVNGDDLRLDTVGGEEVIAGWTTTGQSLTWDFRLVRPDVFRVEITYAATDESKGARFELSVGEETKAGDVLPAAAGATFRTDVLFLAVKRGGRQTLSFRVGGRDGAELMALRSIRFVPKGLSSKKG